MLLCRLTQKVMQHAEAVLRPVMQAMLSRVILGQDLESRLPEDWAELIHQVRGLCLRALLHARSSKDEVKRFASTPAYSARAAQCQTACGFL